MSKDILSEFGDTRPRAIVLDDDDRGRNVLAKDLTNEGFEVCECADVAEFDRSWSPGMFDLIVADWDLSSDQKGEAVLVKVRHKDWDVPFILVSGRLDEDHQKSEVFESMLAQGNCDFVERGDDANCKICVKAFKLLGERDLALLRLILRFRTGARRGVTIATSSGPVSGEEILAEIVKDPLSSHDSESPLADKIAARMSDL